MFRKAISHCLQWVYLFILSYDNWMAQFQALCFHIVKRLSLKNDYRLMLIKVELLNWGLTGFHRICSQRRQIACPSRSQVTLAQWWRAKNTSFSVTSSTLLLSITLQSLGSKEITSLRWSLITIWVWLRSTSHLPSLSLPTEMIMALRSSVKHIWTSDQQDQTLTPRCHQNHIIWLYTVSSSHSLLI